VTSTNDSGPGSLREAIASAADGDTIDFNLPLPNTIGINAPLTIDSNQSKTLTTLTINGPGPLLLAINGADSVVVFVVQPLLGGTGPITATISGLSIEASRQLPLTLPLHNGVAGICDGPRRSPVVGLQAVVCPRAADPTGNLPLSRPPRSWEPTSL